MVRKKEKAKPSSRPLWSGRISFGLVNVPVKLFTMIREQGFSFRLLHKEDGQPLKYERVCVKEDKVVKWDDIAKGYEIRKGEFVVFEKEELDAMRPESDTRIRLDKFIDFFSVDPVFFEKAYILAPDKSEDAYSLLLAAFRKMGKAGVGRITLRTKEHPALIHEHNGILLLTTLRYSYEVVDPMDMDEFTNLKEPGEGELKMAAKIIEELSGEFKITDYADDFKERVEELIEKKMKGETIRVEEPKKEEVTELMVALKETIKQLEKK